MTRHADHFNHLQAVDLPKTMVVEIVLLLLGAFAIIGNSLFELCIERARTFRVR